MEMGSMEQIREVPVASLRPHEKNPRIDAAQVEDLVESIRVHGIEVPLVAAPAADGTDLVVLAGHRRLTAALELGLETVPVQVRADLTDERDQLTFMATENLQRQDLTAVEQSRLFLDLEGLGWSEAEIATASGLKRTKVAESMKLGRLGAETGEKVHRGQITVEDALAIADFEDDPEAKATLEEAAGRPDFSWRLSDAKRRRADREREAALRAEVEKAGGRVVADDADFVPVGELISEGVFTTDKLDASVHLDHEEWAALEISEHASCEGHCARPDRWDGIVWGCDRAADLHGEPAVPEAEPEPDPWDELSADDFATASVHRAEHLGYALHHVDLTGEAKDLVLKHLAERIWPSGGVEVGRVAFVEAMTGEAGKARVLRKLRRYPLPALTYLAFNAFDVFSHDRYMAQGKQGSSYWGPKGAMRKLLALTGYTPTDVEARACELATGRGWFDDETAESGDVGQEA